jgi:hypothetical protein
LLSRLLGNVNLEALFLGSSESDSRVNLSELQIERRIDLESADVSVLSLEALDSLVLSKSISVRSGDSLLWIVLELSSGYSNLLRDIQIRFLSEDGFSLLDEYLGIPPESFWQWAIEWIVEGVQKVLAPPPISINISNIRHVVISSDNMSPLHHNTKAGTKIYSSIILIILNLSVVPSRDVTSQSWKKSTKDSLSNIPFSRHGATKRSPLNDRQPSTILLCPA